MAERLEVWLPVLPQLTLEELDAAVSGELQVFWRTQRIFLALDEAERKAFRRAKTCGFLVAEGWRWPLLGAWFQFCGATRQPYVRAVRDQGWAELLVDHITTGIADSTKMRVPADQAEVLVEKLFNLTRERDTGR